jgi:predicted nucleotide-binding protein (sugar kinase/HSP70/actin superfamily)
MVTNKQLKEIINKNGVEHTDVEVDSFRVLMIELAKLEYQYFKQKNIVKDAAKITSIINLSSNLKNVA